MTCPATWKDGVIQVHTASEGYIWVHGPAVAGVYVCICELCHLRGHRNYAMIIWPHPLLALGKLALTFTGELAPMLSRPGLTPYHRQGRTDPDSMGIGELVLPELSSSTTPKAHSRAWAWLTLTYTHLRPTGGLEGTGSVE